MTLTLLTLLAILCGLAAGVALLVAVFAIYRWRF